MALRKAQGRHLAASKRPLSGPGAPSPCAGAMRQLLRPGRAGGQAGHRRCCDLGRGGGLASACLVFAVTAALTQRRDPHGTSASVSRQAVRAARRRGAAGRQGSLPPALPATSAAPAPPPLRGSGGRAGAGLPLAAAAARGVRLRAARAGTWPGCRGRRSAASRRGGAAPRRPAAGDADARTSRPRATLPR